MSLNKMLEAVTQRVALLTDGRMSGASGRFPAAIHLVPEALDGGSPEGASILGTLA